MKTGFSLCTLSLQGKTCFHYRFFPVKKAYTGKTLFSLQGWVCSADMTFWPDMAFRPDMAIWTKIDFQPEMVFQQKWLFGQKCIFAKFDLFAREFQHHNYSFK
jgi:hypothetical protein